MARALPTTLLACILLFADHSTVHAHQVPNMTVEADFSEGGCYELRVNMDPRTFLSRKPTSLAPLDAAWYLEQSPEQRETTMKMAADMLRAQLRMWLGGSQVPLPEMSCQPLDGATNTPMREDTEELHLLATLRGMMPAGAGDFALEYAQEAQVSLILLIKTPDVPEPRVQVMFPGERSRPVKVPGSPAVVSSMPQPTTHADAKQAVQFTWLWWAAGAVPALLLLRWATRR